MSADFIDEEDASRDNDIETLLGPCRDRQQPRKDWLLELDLTTSGDIKSTLPNIAMIVHDDPRMFGAIAYDEFRERVVARRSIRSNMDAVPPLLVSGEGEGRPWRDADDDSIRAILEAPRGRGKPGYGLRVTDRDLVSAVKLVALRNKFHPVQEYFNSLDWDGVMRVENLLTDYLGCPDTPYHREVARLVLIAAVTRIFEPGHKFDNAMILEGPQGIRKSTFIRVLAKDWFSELHGDLDDQKKMVEQTAGFMILELPELTNLKKQEVEVVKSFLSRTEDTVRAAYGRHPSTHKRQCIFIGSTNDDRYLKDETGNRRFWPVKVSVKSIDTRKLERNVDRLWAEAVTMYREMRKKRPEGDLALTLSREAAAGALEAQTEATLETVQELWQQKARCWLDTPVWLSDLLSSYQSPNHFDDGPFRPDHRLVLRCAFRNEDIWVEALGFDRSAYSDFQIQKLGRAMRSLDGWGRDAKNATRKFDGLQSRWTVRLKGCDDEDRRRGYKFVN